MTYFLPGSCCGEIFKKSFDFATFIACNSFGGNKRKIMKTSINHNALKLSLLQNLRRDVLNIGLIADITFFKFNFLLSVKNLNVVVPV